MNIDPKKIAGLAAWVEKQAEVHHACACNEGDRWDAMRLKEGAEALRDIAALIHSNTDLRKQRNEARAELEKVATERDSALRTKDQSLAVIRNQSLHLRQQETDIATLRAHVAELERASRENLISARIIDAENNQRGHIYAITREAKFIITRTEAALSSPNARSEPATPAPPADTVTTHRQTFFDKARNREMCMESGGEWDGWLFYKHPDGQWISLRKATEADRAAIDAART